MHCVDHVPLLPREIMKIWKGHFRDCVVNEHVKNDARVGLICVIEVMME